MAEVIAPGVRMPTFDGVASSERPGRALHQFRCRVLDAARLDTSTRTVIEDVTGQYNFDPQAYGVRDLSFIFRTVAFAKRTANNGGARRTTDVNASRGTGGGLGIKGQIKTAAELNNLHREYYSKS